MESLLIPVILGSSSRRCSLGRLEEQLAHHSDAVKRVILRGSGRVKRFPAATKDVLTGAKPFAHKIELFVQLALFGAIALAGAHGFETHEQRQRLGLNPRQRLPYDRAPGARHGLTTHTI
jgi:hypothetical protein